MVLRSPRKSFFIVEGNIGAGKSTFLNVLNRYLDVDLVYEPCSRWQKVEGDENLLENFYNDTPRWAYTFQTYAFVTRVLELEKHARESHNPIHVLERSVFSDRYCFAKNCYELDLMSRLEWKLYKDWFNWLVDNYVPIPNGFIYLRVDADVCFDRLTKRNRHEESSVSLDYLKLLGNKHEDWLIEKIEVAPYLANVPVLVLGCNEDFELDTAEQKRHMHNVVDFLKTHMAESHFQTILSSWQRSQKEH